MSTGQVRVLVTGAGGFIGQHLVKYLVSQGHWVRGADLKTPEFQPTAAHEFVKTDLRSFENCLDVTRGVEHVYALAANTEGIGSTEANKAMIVRDNTLIDLLTIEAARLTGVKRFLFTSSAAVYPTYLQNRLDGEALREEDAYPADAEDGYGWEKLYMERIARHYREDFHLETRVVRLDNVYGPLGAYDSGIESPAAVCRGVFLAGEGDAIEVCGDGQQMRSYCYIDDCVEGIYRLMNSRYCDPVNLGADEVVSMNTLVNLVADIAGKRILKKHVLTKPHEFKSDTSRLREALQWEPSTSLARGLVRTYDWVRAELTKAGRTQTAWARA